MTTLELAANLNPEDGVSDVPRDGVVLEWKPGKYAVEHDLYLGTSFDDVNTASVADAAYLGRRMETTYPLNRLDLGRAYYWRVDEVNASPDQTVFKGDVWGFTVEPVGYPLSGDRIVATASSVSEGRIDPQNTVNGAGLDENDQHLQDVLEMWLSGDSEPGEAWIQYAFDRPYKLTQMLVWNHNSAVEDLIGFGIKDALVEYSMDGSNWTSLGVTELARASDRQMTEVDVTGVSAQYIRITAQSAWGNTIPQYGLSEVRFVAVPVYARELTPAQGSTGVDPAAPLSWRAGRDAGIHEVYVGPRRDELSLVDTVVGSPYAGLDAAPLDLQLGQTYYWQVNEVNEAESPSAWTGDILGFTVSDTLVVDDFESYDATDFEDPAAIFNVWVDGFGDNNNGSQVGYGTAPFTEGTTAMGSRSMPLFFGQNDAASSEATRTFAPAQDWTRSGAKSLSISFFGSAGSTGQLYVIVNGTRIDYDGDAANLALADWTTWTIDLSGVANLQSVGSMTIGFDGNASGMVFMDDVLLHP